MAKTRRRTKAAPDLETRYRAIESHGVIGDLQTVALVGLDARIGFLCLPEFDSPTVFASLLDADRGGSFDIMPRLRNPSYKQMYLPDTNVLLTRIHADNGVCEVSDFMPIPKKRRPSCIVRRVKAVRGSIVVDVRCAPRFGYGTLKHRVTVTGNEARFLSS